jgi:hypothetical protein
MVTMLPLLSAWISYGSLLMPGHPLALRPASPGLVFADPAVQETAGNAAPPRLSEDLQQPSRVVVAGVPHVRWSEMALVPYTDWDHHNPSIEAVTRMILGYWNPDLVTTADYASAVENSEGYWQGGQAASADDLKRLLARGIPVLVLLPLTPHAHPLYKAYEVLIDLGVVSVKIPRGVASRALGSMLPLGEAKKFTGVSSNPLRESVTASWRVLIGYDDNLDEWYFHDPSFGPALAIPYNDMERMWAAVGKTFNALVPDSADQLVARRSRAAPYRERTADELAAWEFVNGYAYSATGDLKSGEARLRGGLAVPGVGPGYRFLLSYELAVTLNMRGKRDEALSLAQEAAQIIPDHPGPWHLIAELCKTARRADLVELGAAAAKRWPELQADHEALKRAAKAIPSDFLIDYLVPYRGWGGDPALGPGS